MFCFLGCKMNPVEEKVDGALGRSRKIRLTRTFGENLSPSHWLSFKSHYLLVQRVNKANGIRQWEDPEYCSMMFRLQLSEKPEVWLNQAEAAGESWVKKVQDIITRMEKRFETGMVESRLFVGLRRPSNSQKRFLVRICFGYARWQSMHLGMKCQKQSGLEYCGDLLWGMNNDFIRQEVLRQKWLTAEGKPKEYEEVLNVAEEARSIQMGMRAAGPVTGTGVSDSSVPMTVVGASDSTVLAAQGMPSQRKPFQRMPGQMAPGGQSGQRRRNWMERRGMECWYCHKTHPGGY